MSLERSWQCLSPDGGIVIGRSKTEQKAVAAPVYHGQAPAAATRVFGGEWGKNHAGIYCRQAGGPKLIICPVRVLEADHCIDGDQTDTCLRRNGPQMTFEAVLAMQGNSKPDAPNYTRGSRHHAH